MNHEGDSDKRPVIKEHINQDSMHVEITQIRCIDVCARSSGEAHTHQDQPGHQTYRHFADSLSQTYMVVVYAC